MHNKVYLENVKKMEEYLCMKYKRKYEEKKSYKQINDVTKRMTFRMTK